MVQGSLVMALTWQVNMFLMSMDKVLHVYAHTILHRMQAVTYIMFPLSIYDNTSAAMTTVGNVLVDQSEADEDLSVTQRLALAGGSALEGAADFAGDIQPLADTLTVAGMCVMLSALEYII